MGKYDNMMKCAQVRSLSNEKQYRNAYEVIQTLNINQITAITDLNTIADVYIQLQKYVEAKDIYKRLYDKIPTRRVLYQLVYLSLKCGEIEEAEEYYSEYEELDKSSDRIILRYYIDKAKGADRQVLIRYLQQLKREDYMEEWAYELAKLYHKEGMIEECIQECSDIILWFGEGLIVEKAMLLKHHYTDGADISSEKAIMEETRNIAAELRIAAAIAERNEKEQEDREEAERIQAEQEEAERIQAEREAELLYVKPENLGMDAVYEPVYTQQEELIEETAYEEEPQYEEQAAYEENSLYEEETIYEEESLYEEETIYEEELASDETEASEGEIFAEDASEIEEAIASIVKDIKGEKEPGHIAVTGKVSDKNIEIGKLLAKELFRQQVLPTSKIARITAERLNEVSLEENRQELVGGCLFIEETSKLSLDSIQNLYQFIRKTRGSVVVILSDTEEKMEALLKKNRKLGNIVEYHIEI